ncbi:MAG: DNA polymerase Y family protein [Alphaproteobacteria bacterium]|nr:DNA polymerase Y family protein [Alphaproteobacteria bacterium]
MTSLPAVPRRILYLWLPGLALERLDTAFGAGPTVIVHGASGRREVIAACPLALAAGITPGRSAADARALVPGLHMLPADPDGQRATLETLADWCGRYSPTVSTDPPAQIRGDGGMWLDVTGCAHLSGGETALCRDIHARLTGLGWTARIALADTPGAAWAVARFSSPDLVVVLPGAQRAAISPLPVAALRLPAETAEALGKVGMRRIGTLFEVPRASIAPRFGREVTLRIDQALGTAPDPLPHRPFAVPHRVGMSVPEPVGTRDALEHLARNLLQRLIARMARASLGIRRLELVFRRVDGSAQCLAVGTSRCSRDVAALWRLFAQHLDTVDPGFGIEAAFLDAVIVEPFLAETPDFSGRGDGVGLADLRDRITNRLGTAAVTRAVPQSSHLPELAEVRTRACRSGWPADAPGPRRDRPLHLLHPPEPVTAVALVPDHPPVRFRWRGTDIRVVCATGPERLAPEWWRETRRIRTRDYFRVEDGDGRRYWLFREGLAERGETPAWHLHGLFA